MPEQPNTYPLTPEWVSKVRDFIWDKWRNRAKELGRPEPTDFSGACKFASLFGKEIFGLGIQGNWGHQFNVLPSGKPLDLLEGKAGEVGYLHDKEFFNNPEHRKSLESCKARVADWAKEFRQRYPLAGKTATQARWSSPLLDGLKAEARKAPTFEDFKYDFSIDIKHGMYFHVTKDPSFRIDSEKGPVDASSLASSDRMEKGKLMVTSHLDYWLAEYEGYRTYVAIIDMSDVPRNAYHQVSRGFGNEFMVTDPSQAKVQQVLPIAKAQRLDERHHAALDFASDDDLLEFYNLFHDPEAPQWKSPKEQGKLPFRGKGMTVAKLRPMRNDLLNLRNPTPEVLPPVDTDPYEAHRPLPDIGEMIGTPGRWYKDLGAIPGEALFTLDSDDENSEGKAAIVETDTEPVEYELYLPDGELLGMTGKPLDPLNTQSVQQLAERAEKYIDAHPGAGRPAIDIEAQPSTPPLLPAKEAGSFDEPFPDGRVDYFEEPQNPHSDREKEVGIDIAKDAASGRRTKILWLRYEDRIYSTPTTMRVLDHSQWLQNMSLPWFGPAYDAIERGTALADGRANRVYITRNGGGFAEQDVIEHLVSKYHLEGWDIREEDSNNLRMDASVKTASWSGLAYHGTMYGAPEVFQTEPEDIKRRSGVDINALLGAHFAQEPQVASRFAQPGMNDWMAARYEGESPKPRVIPVYLRITKPKDFGRERNLRWFIYEGKLNGHAGDEILDQAMRMDGLDPEDETDPKVTEWLQMYDTDSDFRMDQNQAVIEGSSAYADDLEEAARELAMDARERLEAAGFDGIRYVNEIERGISWIVFNPNQVKSAFGNTGKFNRKNPNMTASKTAAGEWWRRWRKTFLLKKGTILYHGTSQQFPASDISTPAWFTTSESVADHFKDWHGGEEASRVLVYKVIKPIRLPQIDGKEDLDKLFHMFGAGGEFYGAEDMVDFISDSGLPGWYIPHNYPDGDDILLVDSGNLEALRDDSSDEEGAGQPEGAEPSKRCLPDFLGYPPVPHLDEGHQEGEQAVRPHERHPRIGVDDFPRKLGVVEEPEGTYGEQHGARID